MASPPVRGMLLALGLLTFAGDAFALRCGHKLVQVGDHKSEVLEKCGEPDSVEERRALRGSRLRHPYGSLEIDQFEEVLIEEWIYNFGPRKFQQLLEFEDGELKKIRNLSYGY
ncbi:MULTISPECIES: DUF2845 domain-containing protein [Methylomonas]|uniref:DUF2845 domain-containing protein n=2 Tax=Methylomonas TaxID=416 RepID=A0A140E571_9GAMM|nr:MULTISPECIES: DUF2845 domain-containing protein [Methylomonas]AMK75545.1 hypothetical protein JT25_003430 [Methylomonas denitrificans]OAI09164.1 hypothetical protein A1342_08185 [Methylomonas methanica]TCV79041.1 uncharacterized protein DUF2845 [Methylomonas methanica]